MRPPCSFLLPHIFLPISQLIPVAHSKSVFDDGCDFTENTVTFYEARIGRPLAFTGISNQFLYQTALQNKN